MSTEQKPPIQLPNMCDKHQRLLVQQAKYAETDPWQALIMVCQVVLFQGASANTDLQKELGGDITRISELGCMACRKPDLFGEVVEVAKSKDLGKIKALGEKWCGL